MVLLNTTAGPVERAVHVRDRLAARMRADQIDRELAGGASPDATVRNSLRAFALTSWRSRQVLAHALSRTLRVAAKAASAPRYAPLNRPSVMAAGAELAALRERLLAPGPVAAEGVARTRILLTDAGGPLYRRRADGELRRVARGARAALDLPTPSAG
jgi:hypothetical protein